MHPVMIGAAVAVLLLIRLFLPFLDTLRSSLRTVPGPFITRFTRLWYFRQVCRGDFHLTNLALHKKYGPIVRIAPDHYSISNPDKTVYGLRSQFPKSTWYEGWKHPSPDRWTLFPDQNIKRHNETRKRFQHMYSMSSLVTYEHYVDVCADVFKAKLSEFGKSHEVIDMTHWFYCYAFDVIGSITYSKRFGFLDRGEDVEGAMGALQKSMVYSTCVGVYPWAHPTLYGIMEKWFPKSGAAGRSYIMKFVQGRVDDRKQEREKGQVMEKKLEEGDQVMPEDFLDKILDANEEDPKKVTDYHVFMMGISNIIAGSDTTAVSLSSILYHLIKFPHAMKALREEIATFEKEGKCGEDKVTFAQAQEMPYLQACIKEGLRVHSATGLPLWRVVPQGGTEVQGVYLPAGTVVGLNTWVAHFDESVFGPDAKDFKPERWLEAEKQGGDKVKTMDAYYMPFGLGSRTCLGRHISHLEMSKLLPVLVKNFDWELIKPDQEWTTENYWFVKPVDFNVKVKSRY